MTFVLAPVNVVITLLGYALQVIGLIATLCFLYPITFPVYFLLLRQTLERPLALTGMSNLLIFAISVSIPFHLQGFSELLTKCEWHSGQLSCPDAPPGDPTGNGIGLTRIPGIDAISYMLTLGFGLPVLVTSSICVIAGKFANHRIYDLTIKSILMAFAIWSSQNLHQYQVIADWTD